MTSNGGCGANVACDLFIQQAETFSGLAEASQQAIRVEVAANAASHFTPIAVGDRVDVAAFASRVTAQGRNELVLQVNTQLQGCAKVVGAGAPVPVDVQLSDLTVAAYEATMGPLLVRVTTVSGRPQQPTESFGLWQTGAFSDAGITTITNLNPSYIAGSAFSGLSPSVVTDFASVTGVFAVLVSSGTKYEELYPRTMTDLAF